MGKLFKIRFSKSYSLRKAKACFIGFLFAGFLHSCNISINPEVEEEYELVIEIPSTTSSFIQPSEEDKRACLVKTYRSYDGIVEITGKNDHPKIDYFFELLNMAPRQSWCAALLHAAFYNCNIPTQINAWSPTGHNAKNLVWFNNRFIKDAKLADVTAFWNISKNRIDHVGFWDGDISDGKYYSFEGNYSNRSGRVIRSYKLTYSISRHL
jgi:hypothetical protein